MTQKKSNWRVGDLLKSQNLVEGLILDFFGRKSSLKPGRFGAEVA